jgi:hypothetical protein
MFLMPSDDRKWIGEAINGPYQTVTALHPRHERGCYTVSCITFYGLCLPCTIFFKEKVHTERPYIYFTIQGYLSWPLLYVEQNI